MKRLSNDQISTLCMELALMLRAGISADDGLHLILEDQTAAADAPAVKFLSDRVDDGVPLASAMRESGAFPAYAPGLVEVGTRTGRLEEALRALSNYYNARARLEMQVRGAILYPALLLLLMLAVVVVLMTKVLPVFDQVFQSLGGEMTGVAGGLLLAGRWMDGALPFLCAILAAAAAAMAAFVLSSAFRAGCLRAWKKGRGLRGMTGRLTTSQIAQALSMGLRSGLPMEDALGLASELTGDVPAAKKKCEDCRDKLEGGAPVAETLRQAELLPAVYCRMLALGVRSGSADAVMEEISRRLDQESEEGIQAQVSRVEPALTIGGSLLVGIILLSAMLPLLNILSAIG